MKRKIVLTTTAIALAMSLTLGATAGRANIMPDIDSEVSGILDSVLGPIRSYIDQFDQLRDSIVDRILSSITGQITEQIEGTLDEVLGSLNLPDPTKILEQIESQTTGSSGTGENGEVADFPVHQLNPVIVRSTMTAAINADVARIHALSLLTTEAQDAMAQEIEALAQQVTGTQESAEGSGQLATQATDASTQASSFGQQAQAAAQQAQSRVSTQDAIKDLALVSASVSSQMTQLSRQSAAQSGQLANLATQGATLAQLESSQLFRQGQIAVGIAAGNQVLADMGDRIHGQEQNRIIQDNASVNRLSQLNSIGFRLAQ